MGCIVVPCTGNVRIEVYQLNASTIGTALIVLLTSNMIVAFLSLTFGMLLGLPRCF